MRLIQIPFSHNCIKVRRALELKGLAFETLDINPRERRDVERASGQRLTPVLVDDETTIAESTAILRYLETTYPEPSLLPDGEDRRAECWLLEDWADQAFMAMSRRVAYWSLLRTPGALERLWFPQARGLKRRLMVRAARRVLVDRFRLSAGTNALDETEALRVSRLALERLAGRPRLFNQRWTVADVALASMSAPLRAAADAVRNDTAVHELLTWGETVLGPEIIALYRGI